MATASMKAAPSDGVSPLRAARLLVRLRFIRQYNQLAAIYRFRKRATGRTGTARKGAGRFLAAFFLLVMVGNFVNLSFHAMANIQNALGVAEIPNPVQHGWLGVRVSQNYAPASGELKPAPAGVRIVYLFDGAAAKRQGLALDDVIVSFDGKPVRLVQDFLHLARSDRAGAPAQIGFLRAGVAKTKQIELDALPEDLRPLRQTIPAAPGETIAPAVLHGAIFETSLLFVAALFMALAAREIIQAEWDLEWLAALPLPLSTLVAGKILERAASNGVGFVFLGGFLTAVGWQCGLRWSAPFAALALSLPMLLIAGALQMFIDTGLRLSLAPTKLRNLQALISALASVPLLLALAAGLRNDSFVFGFAAATPAWIRYLPPGVAVSALSATGGLSASVWSAILVCEALAVTALVYIGLTRRLRDGVVASGAREAAPRVRRIDRPERRPSFFSARLSAVQRREIRLLARDRGFLAQTLIVPFVTVAMQVAIQSRSNIFAGAVDHPEYLATIAFGLAAYTLMFSAFQTLNAEGRAMWILYCVPRSLETILRQKAALWGVIALAYPLVAFAVAIALAGHLTTQFMVCATVVLIGAPIFATIGVALGVFAFDPFAEDARRRIRPTYLYLYFALCSLYGYAVYAATIWQRGATMILTALLAIALWQKARDQFDYLLDPTAAPPARVSVSDGMIAALVFFVLQGVVVIFFRTSRIAINAPELWFAFSAAGALTYGAMRLAYWRAKTTGVPKFLGANWANAVNLGLAGGAVAAMIGVVYLEIVARFGWASLAPNGDARLERSTEIWFGALAVLCAPIFEEFIFRGLIFGGLRRSLGLGAATLASAAIFAIIHPPLSIVPVFFMAICAALVYERTKLLAGPMTVHAFYNAAVLIFQWFFL
jgi:ABC-2 type transport system permease protein